MENDTLMTLKLSIQRALLGEVTKNLRAVTAGVKGSKILLRFYFDEGAAESELENVSSIGAEVISDFTAPFVIEEQIMFVTDPQNLDMLDFWAFVRAKA